MTTVFVHHRVADYNTWRPEFDRAVKADWSKDMMKKELADDGLHPNAAGYRVVAPLAEAGIEKALE